MGLTEQDFARLNENYIVALALWREARGVAPALRRSAYQAILDTIDERLRRHWPRKGPKSRIGIILDPLQFSSFNLNDPNVRAFPEPSAKADWIAFVEAMDVVMGPVNPAPLVATHYHSLPKQAVWPNWARGANPVRTIGPFYFYNLAA